MNNGNLMNRHKLSTPFGEMAKADFAELVLSMRTRGFDSLHPIVTYDGNILDGWHRYKASQESKVVPIFLEFEGTEEEAQQLVFAENMPRRHMTQRQKIAAFQCMNALEKQKSKKLSVQDIQARVGINNPQLVSQMARLADSADKDVIHHVASGKVKAATAIREVLKEEPTGASKTNNLDKPTTFDFTLRKLSLMKGFEHARLEKGLPAQSAFNKAIELFIEWAEVN